MKTIKTLFISDLDGTLLNEEKTISPESAEILRTQVERGLLFSIATARSAATVIDICAPLGLRLPIVLMNGVFVFDLERRAYLHKNPIPFTAAYRTLRYLSQKGISPFLYMLEDEELCVEFTALPNIGMKEFYAERTGKAYKRFRPVENHSVDENACIVYMTIIDTEEELRPLYEWVGGEQELSASLYRDNYSAYWYLEIYSAKADKASGIAWLKSYAGAEKVVVFGDNFNDLGMLRFADEGYVVQEAPEAVKARATGVIGSNKENAVARFIAKHSETTRLPGPVRNF